MSCLDAFAKAGPCSLAFQPRVDLSTRYKYYLCGKGCVLGVLFEDSTSVYFEWLSEENQVVDYPPPLRYKFWPKHEVARLVQTGYWDVETERTALPTLAA